MPEAKTIASAPPARIPAPQPPASGTAPPAAADRGAGQPPGLTENLVGISLVEGLLATLFNLFADGLMLLSIILMAAIVGWLLLPIAVVFKFLIWFLTLLWLIMRGMWRGAWTYFFGLFTPFQTAALWAAIGINNAFIKKLTAQGQRLAGGNAPRPGQRKAA